MWGIDVVASPIERAFRLNLMALTPPTTPNIKTKKLYFLQSLRHLIFKSDLFCFFEYIYGSVSDHLFCELKT